MPGRVLPNEHRATYRPSALAWLLAIWLGAEVGWAGTARGEVPGPVAWPVGKPVPIAVAAGHVRFDLPTPGASESLVIVSSLARAAGPFSIQLRTQHADQVHPPPLDSDGPLRAPTLIGPITDPIPEPPADLPPGERIFHLMVRDGDVASASNYIPLRSKLRAVGRRVQVYVDGRDVGRVSDALLKDIVATFDDRIFPTAARTMGIARDVDDDGRFTVLVTGWLTRLGGGRMAVDGFVRGADLDPDLGAPFGNRCDMMYLSAQLQPGPHLHTLLAHEYTHAVTASLKTFGGLDGARWGPEEEGWLDEALAHLAEDQHGFSRTNLDYRISAFLSSPERYRLVVEDYYASDLFRSHGNRGSTYLFLRFCADQYGPSLLGTLARSPKRGAANLEAATGLSFPALFRQWTIALAQSGLETGTEPDSALAYRSIPLHGHSQGWPLAGPRVTRKPVGGAPETWTGTGTSAHFSVVEGSTRGAISVEISGPAEADLQVTIIPLPAGLPQVELTATAAAASDGTLMALFRLQERAGVAARIEAISWEPLIPQAATRRFGMIERVALDSALGSDRLEARGTLTSAPVPLTGVHRADGRLVVKAIGTDSRGRRWSAWADLPGPPGTGSLAADSAAVEPMP